MYCVGLCFSMLSVTPCVLWTEYRHVTSAVTAVSESGGIVKDLKALIGWLSGVGSISKWMEDLCFERKSVPRMKG